MHERIKPDMTQQITKAQENDRSHQALLNFMIEAQFFSIKHAI